jgi:hypothetical protein
VLGLLTGYTQLEKTRIITPKETLQQRLGGQLETDHTRIYYAEQAISDQEVDRMATEIEFYIHQIQHSLGIDKPDSSQKIELYLYAHPWQKKEFVGAKYTSYVTVWQQVPQVHIAKTQVDGSLKHEVVHAVTALLPSPGLVPNIGLTEGIAVALNPDRSPRSTIDQLVAAHKPYPTAEQMSSSLSYWGFYTNRSAVSYTTAGSFVRYLIEEKPPQQFLEAYRCGSLEQGYSESFSTLVEGWHKRLDSVRIDSSDRERASEIFGRLSIFEQQCPHKVPRAAELFDQYLLHETLNDTTRVISTLAALKEIDPEEHSPRLLWMLWNLRAGQPQPVIAGADPKATRIEHQLLTADAQRMASNEKEATEYLNHAIQLAAQQSDTTFDEAFAVRLDSLQWGYDLRLRYDKIILQPEEFDRAYYRLKIRALQNAMDLEADNNLLENYADRLLTLPLDLEAEGFVRLSAEYFEGHGRADPAVSWRTGFTLAEVRAGHAVDRRGADGADLSHVLVEGLRDGSDHAVLGPPGAGKSTVCMQAACEWYERELGPVLYRERGGGDGFESTALLEAYLREQKPPRQIENLAVLARELGAQGNVVALFAPTPLAREAATATATATPVSLPTQTPTPTRLPTETPPATMTATATRQPSPSPRPVYWLLNQQRVCQSNSPATRIEVEVLDALLDPLPGVEVVVNWEDGSDRFFTGFKPAQGPGYADFAMRPDVSYTVMLPQGSPEISGLRIEPCDNGLDGGWRLTFQNLLLRPTETPAP